MYFAIFRGWQPLMRVSFEYALEELMKAKDYTRQVSLDAKGRDCYLGGKLYYKAAKVAGGFFVTLLVEGVWFESIPGPDYGPGAFLRKGSDSWPHYFTVLHTGTMTSEPVILEAAIWGV